MGDFRKKNPGNTQNWVETTAESSWRMFKIMAEFVDGFERMERIGPCVSIFGSARTKPDNKYYKLAVEIAEKLCKEGYGVITGGGPGIMEAGNQGAKKAEGKSVGLNIELPFEQSGNKYIDHDKEFNFRYFFVRKVMFIKYAQGFVCMPGGFGTLDELFEALTLIQTRKVDRVPIVLVGTEYWGGLIDWLKNTMLEQQGNISKADLDLWKITDDADAAVRYINDFYSNAPNALRPNF